LPSLHKVAWRALNVGGGLQRVGRLSSSARPAEDETRAALIPKNLNVETNDVVYHIADHPLRAEEWEANTLTRLR